MPSWRRSRTTRTSSSASTSRVRRIEIENGRAVGRHLPGRQGRGSPGLCGRRGHRRSRRAGHAAAPHAVRHRPCRSAAGARHRLHRRPARRRREPDRPPGGADHREGEWAAMATTGRASAGGCSSTAFISSSSARARSSRPVSRPAPSSIRPIRTRNPRSRPSACRSSISTATR